MFCSFNKVNLQSKKRQINPHKINNIIFLQVLLILLLGPKHNSHAQKSPQIYNNLFVGWPIKNQLALRSSLSYNFLYLDPRIWNELSASSTLARGFKDSFEGTFGLYFARVQQSKNLSNYEIRPVLGFRIFSNSKKKIRVGNYSRMEFRYLIYSDNENDGTARFRNRTTFTVSINRPTVSATTKNLFVFGYFEAFNNFSDDTRERFFKLFKTKLGLAYRIDSKWTIDLGVIYLDSNNKIMEPNPLITIIDTNYIFEWEIGYRIRNDK